jgi:AraC family transcriptional regulator
MVKPKRVPEDSGVALDPPKFVSSGPLLIIGLSERHSFETTQELAAQWRKFMATYGEIANKAQPIPVGIATNMDADGNFEYVCGVEVSKFSTTPRGLVQLRIPAHSYAVFQHREHVSKIAATYSAILNN